MKKSKLLILLFIPLLTTSCGTNFFDTNLIKINNDYKTSHFDESTINTFNLIYESNNSYTKCSKSMIDENQTLFRMKYNDDINLFYISSEFHIKLAEVKSYDEIKNFSCEYKFPFNNNIKILDVFPNDREHIFSEIPITSIVNNTFYNLGVIKNDGIYLPTEPNPILQLNRQYLSYNILDIQSNIDFENTKASWHIKFDSHTTKSFLNTGIIFMISNEQILESSFTTELKIQRTFKLDTLEKNKYIFNNYTD